MPQAIESFIKRFHRAVAGRSPEIRLTLQEANDLVQEVNTLLARLADRTAAPTTPAVPLSGFSLDGGSLKDLK